MMSQNEFLGCVLDVADFRPYVIMSLFMLYNSNLCRGAATGLLLGLKYIKCKYRSPVEFILYTPNKLTAAYHGEKKESVLELELCQSLEDHFIYRKLNVMVQPVTELSQDFSRTV